MSHGSASHEVHRAANLELFKNYRLTVFIFGDVKMKPALNVGYGTPFIEVEIAPFT
jgi:hypothetical protein